MTQENKELLLKDLSARLPYRVKVQFDNIDTFPAILEGIDNHLIICDITICELEDVKPYLRPMASMTKEEREEFNKVIGITLKDLENDELFSCLGTIAEVDFYHKNHFDYRGLIERGLAIDATGLNIY